MIMKKSQGIIETKIVTMVGHMLISYKLQGINQKKGINGIDL